MTSLVDPGGETDRERDLTDFVDPAIVAGWMDRDGLVTSVEEGGYRMSEFELPNVCGDRHAVRHQQIWRR